MDSLQDLLHGQTPGVQFLWDYQRERKTWCPKEETKISDYVAVHLRRDVQDRGIVVNREVGIRPLLDIEPGQITDILVEGVIPSPRGENYDVVQVIVETKGCWNRDLYTAMRSQLVERYLKDNQCRYGLYLVGYFLCDSWDGEDYRKGDCPRKSIDALVCQFDCQAAESSRDGLTLAARVLDLQF